eukprot:5615831-Karenia_brevis.AAC.1
MAVAPAIAWAKEVWRAVTAQPGNSYNLGELCRLWNGAQPQNATTWARCRGPMSAAVLSFRRIGWSVN